MTHTQFSRPNWKYAACALAVSVLAGMTLLAAGGQAEAGYSCTGNSTKVGNLVTIEIAAVSGGPYTRCIDGHTVNATPQFSYNVSATVTSTQVGATDGGYFAVTEAFSTAGVRFSAFCTQSGQGGVCSGSNTGTLQGISVVNCDMSGEQIVLPDPALPLVPVTLTAVCTFNY